MTEEGMGLAEARKIVQKRTPVTVPLANSEEDATIEWPGDIKVMHLAATMPEGIEKRTGVMEPGDWQWIGRFVRYWTDLEVPRGIRATECYTVSDISRIAAAVDSLMHDEDVAQYGAEQYRVAAPDDSSSWFAELDLNDDGSVDLEDMR